MAITPRGNPRNEGWDSPIRIEGETFYNPVEFKGSGSLTAENLPRFYLHGFPPPDKKPKAQIIKGSTGIETRLNPYDNYAASDIFKIAENTPIVSGGLHANADDKAQAVSSMKDYYVQQGLTEADAERKANARYQALSEFRDRIKAGEMSDYEQLINSDISADVELTRFVVDCSWMQGTEAPYSSSTITLKMPSALAHYVMHGRLASVDLEQLVKGEDTSDANKVLTTDGFRHIEAGGWMSLRTKDEGRALFLGKITAVNINTSVDPTTGVMQSVIKLECGSFLYPFFVGEHRITPMELDAGLKKIDRAALSGYSYTKGAKASSADEKLQKMAPTLWAIVKYVEQEDALTSEMLSFYLKELGHFVLPPSLIGNTEVEGYKKLGANMRILDGTPTGMVNTPYSLASSYTDAIDHVSGRPEPSYVVQAFVAGNLTMWQIIQSIFQPDPDFIELFPVLLPIPKPQDAVPSKTVPDSLVVRSSFVAAQYGTVDQQLKSQPLVVDPLALGVSPLAKNLNAVPALIYRFKPLPPDFDISSDALSDNYRFAFNRSPNGRPYAEEFFGKKNREDDLKTKDAGYRYLVIDGGRVVAQDLTWTDLDRINAVHLAAPFENAEMAQRLLFGVSSVPVFNAIDINRNGLRLKTGKAPFYRFAKGLTGKDPKLMIAASAFCERLYYLRGEGHSYAKGTITCSYIENATLIPGMWAKIKYSDGRYGNNSGRRSQATGRYADGARDLYFYIKSVQHGISIDPLTGVPKAATVLVIERASYSNRIPAVELRQTANHVAPPTPPEDRSRIKVRRPNIQGKQPPRADERIPAKPVVPAAVKFSAPDPTVPNDSSTKQKDNVVAATPRVETTPAVAPLPADSAPAKEDYSRKRAVGYLGSYKQLLVSELFFQEKLTSAGTAYAVLEQRTVEQYDMRRYNRVAGLDYPAQDLDGFHYLLDTRFTPPVVRYVNGVVVEAPGEGNPYPAAAPYIFDVDGVRRADRYGVQLFPDDMRQESGAGSGDSDARGWLGFWDDQRNVYRIQWTDGSVLFAKPLYKEIVDSTGNIINYGIPDPVPLPGSSVGRYTRITGKISDYYWERLWFIPGPESDAIRAAAAAAVINTAANRAFLWGSETPR